MSQDGVDRGVTNATWQLFVHDFQLDLRAQERFSTYMSLLCEWNSKFNITRIIQSDDIIRYHLTDALTLGNYIAINKYHSLCDVGSGGGIPGLALAVMFENIPVRLLEVNQKRISFLEMVIDRLQLNNVSVDGRDFRTFIRAYGSSDIDLVVARASLSPDELIRIFKPSSALRHATLVYFASATWTASKAVMGYVRAELPYMVGKKDRKYVVMRGNCLREIWYETID